jgi:type VI secretion system secreted protein Hcp
MDYMVLSILTKDAATVDVKGECKLKDYEDHIEVLSYSHGVSLPIQPGTSNTGRTTGRPNFGELSITKQLDSTTPALNYYCAQAKNMGTLKLKIVRQDSTNAAAGQVLYMTYTLDKTLISSVSVGGSGDIPVETVTFNYSKITWTYIPQKKDIGAEGNIEKYWDQETNTGTA